MTKSLHHNNKKKYCSLNCGKYSLAVILTAAAAIMFREKKTLNRECYSKTNTFFTKQRGESGQA